MNLIPYPHGDQRDRENCLLQVVLGSSHVCSGMWFGIYFFHHLRSTDGALGCSLALGPVPSICLHGLDTTVISLFVLMLTKV